MDTSQIKRFAVEARNILKQGVINRIAALGFNDKGEVEERNKPQLLQGNTLFMGQLYDENFYGKWMALYNRVQTKGIKEVYEEAAYTWFNRLMAIRIMEKNGFTEPVLAFDDDRFRIPRIVANARAGQFSVDASDREKLSELLMNDTKTTEQFTLLITSFCHTNPVINNCFGGVSDYTEILLPTNILSEGGFVDMLNHTAFITDDDYRQSELIGWLYQFYISEKKDEVFANFDKGKKAEAEDIPAATQIFTPNWIVKYMVQNTVGRIFLDNNPDSDLKDKWKYLVEPSAQTPDDCIFKYDDPKELTMADLGCGSGHILNEGFDILYDIYIEEGYSRKQAIENIFKYNLTGVDIDTRAKQLATFALMMKACQKDDSFLDCHVMPNVLDMPEVRSATWQDLGGHLISALQTVDWPDTTINKELNDCFELMEKANNLGSIMKFEISPNTRKFIVNCIEEKERQEQNIGAFIELFKGLELILALTNKYASLAMNPPYMKSANMNAELSSYLKNNYTEGKADLFSTFMMVAIDHLAEKGKYGMINMHSWMFLSSFENLRIDILKNHHIDNMLHLGTRTFDELSGEVVQNTAYVISNHTSNYGGDYYRLVDGKNCTEKQKLFLQALLSQQIGIYYPNISQSIFENIPGCVIGYWIPNNILEIFRNSPSLDSYSSPRKGNSTSNNAKFLRLWNEVSFPKVALNYKEIEVLLRDGKRWVPYNKGGGVRKWYGYNETLVDWKDNAQEIRNIPTSVVTNEAYYMKPGLTWSTIATGKFGVRFFEDGFIFDNGGCCLFDTKEKRCYLAALLNSNILDVFVKVISPTLNYQSGVISKLPIKYEPKDFIDDLAWTCRNISKQDWDAHETSWDFETNELVSINEGNFLDIIADYADLKGICIDPAPAKPNSLEWHLNMYHKKWDTKFHRLHQNEEELNRQFIEIYGLQDELTPDVPLDEITILQQGEISIEDNQIVWHDDVIIKQLISYAIGCMMGRYRLDKPGLWIAHPNPTPDEICTYHYKGNNYTIDDDGIMPLMSRDCGFDDNGVLRFTEFLRVAFGEECLTENLNYVEECLGKTIEDYLKKDFWKYHKKMYQNRPIYWLFSSKKGAFQVLAYMHRMNPYTVEQIRNKYLLPHIEYLNGRIAEMEVKEATLSTSERRTLSKLKENLVECQEYHERLHLVADKQINFDLDDGVMVNYAKFGDVVAKIK